MPSGSRRNVVPGVTVTSWSGARACGAGARRRQRRSSGPILVILTLPITVLTLGLFYLVVNGMAFGLAAALVPGLPGRVLGRPRFSGRC